MLVDLSLLGIERFETADRAKEQRPGVDVVVMVACKPEVTRKDADVKVVEVMKRSDANPSEVPRSALYHERPGT